MPGRRNKVTEMAAAGDVLGLIGASLGARSAADEGRWCACADPLVGGRGLMCASCLLENQEQYLDRTRSICDAHDFHPHDRFDGAICKRCAMGADDPRHHGVSHPLPVMPWEAP